MKNIIFLITVLFSNFFFSQEYPLDYKGDVPDGAYYKDINNELNKYIGLWKGTWNGKTIYLQLKKIKYYYDGNHPFYCDEIRGERKIINSNGVVEIDRISTFGQGGAEFSGVSTSLRNGNWKRFLFFPKNMCRKFGTLDITNFTGTTMTLHFEYQPSAIDENCIHNAYVDKYGDFPINFPKDITLTKQ